MGNEYIILDLTKLKIVKKSWKVLIFDNLIEAEKYAKKGKYKVIQL